MTLITTYRLLKKTDEKKNCGRRGENSGATASQKKPTKNLIARLKFPARNRRPLSIIETTMLYATITLRTPENQDIASYKKTLQNDWSRETLAEIFSQLESLVAPALQQSNYPWRKVLVDRVESKSSHDFDPTILDRLRDLSDIFREPSIPTVPKEFNQKRRNHFSALAERAWAFLILPGMADLQGSTGFFADVQSLLYLCLTHTLLPKLQTDKHRAEHDCLVAAMYVHTYLVWRMQPAHMFYLQTVLMDHLGNAERQLELLHISLMLTPLEDHAYLTRATAYWSALMEQKRYSAAKEFLWSLPKQDSYQDEIGEMLAETVVESTSALSLR